MDKNTNKKYEIPKEYNCCDINHFIIQLTQYSNSIYEDIKNNSFDSTTKKQNTPENLVYLFELYIYNILDKRDFLKGKLLFQKREII